MYFCFIFYIVKFLTLFTAEKYMIWFDLKISNDPYRIQFDVNLILNSISFFANTPFSYIFLNRILLLYILGLHLFTKAEFVRTLCTEKWKMWFLEQTKICAQIFSLSATNLSSSRNNTKNICFFKEWADEGMHAVLWRRIL